MQFKEIKAFTGIPLPHDHGQIWGSLDNQIHDRVNRVSTRPPAVQPSVVSLETTITAVSNGSRGAELGSESSQEMAHSLVHLDLLSPVFTQKVHSPHLSVLTLFPWCLLRPQRNSRHCTDQEILLLWRDAQRMSSHPPDFPYFQGNSHERLQAEDHFLTGPHTSLFSKYSAYSGQMCSSNTHLKNMITCSQMSLLWRGRGSRVMSSHFQCRVDSVTRRRLRRKKNEDLKTALDTMENQ